MPCNRQKLIIHIPFVRRGIKKGGNKALAMRHPHKESKADETQEIFLLLSRKIFLKTFSVIPCSSWIFSTLFNTIFVHGCESGKKVFVFVVSMLWNEIDFGA